MLWTFEIYIQQYIIYLFNEDKKIDTSMLKLVTQRSWMETKSDVYLILDNINYWCHNIRVTVRAACRKKNIFICLSISCFACLRVAVFTPANNCLDNGGQKTSPTTLPPNQGGVVGRPPRWKEVSKGRVRRSPKKNTFINGTVWGVFFHW